MPRRIELVLRRVLEVVLVLATFATVYAVLLGEISGVTLGAIVPVLVSLSVTVDHLNRRGGRRPRCLPDAGE